MISIIVPVYNTEKYLKKCLDSLINQTYKDIEIIIVNDGSTDNSKDILKEYQEKYPNIIKYYEKENGGLSSARNYGIQKSKGSYLAFVDSDDYVSPYFIEKMYDFAKKNVYEIVVCDSIKVFNDHEEILKSNPKYSVDDVKNYIISHPMACTRLIKKDLFTDQYMFTIGTYYEDLCLMPTFVNKTIRIGFLDEALYYYYQRENSIMNQKAFNEKFYDIITVLKHVYETFLNNKNLDAYYDEVEYLFIIHLVRTTALKFAVYDNFSDLYSPVSKVMNEYFPSWKSNKYLKKSSLKFKLVCFLARHNNSKLLKALIKIRK